MPDESRPLTQKQRDKAINWINSKTKDHKCPVCGHDQWHLGPDIINAIPQGKQVLLAQPVYPQVFIVCTNCYFVQYFMAVAMGVVDEEEDTMNQKSEEISDG